MKVCKRAMLSRKVSVDDEARYICAAAERGNEKEGEEFSTATDIGI